MVYCLRTALGRRRQQQASADDSHTDAVTSWGPLVAEHVPLPEPAAQFSDDLRCAILTSGRVFCPRTLAEGPVEHSALIASLTNVRTLASSAGSFCALLGDGATMCGGLFEEESTPTDGDDLDAENRTRSRPSFEAGAVMTPAGVPRLRSLVGAAAGAYCGTADDASVICFSIRLSADHRTLRGVVAANLGLPRDPASLRAARLGMCALYSNGEFWCAGQRLFAPECRTGEVRYYRGDESLTCLSRDAGHTSLVATDAADASVDDHVCVLNRAGVVSCYGDNRMGQLGISPTPPRLRWVLRRRCHSFEQACSTRWWTPVDRLPADEIREDAGADNTNTFRFADTYAFVPGWTVLPAGDCVGVGVSPGLSCVITRAHEIRCFGNGTAAGFGALSPLASAQPVYVRAAAMAERTDAARP